jgi:DNA-binding CsgD family transcriptional regulator
MNRKKENKLIKDIVFSSLDFENDTEFLKLKEIIEKIKAKYNTSNSDILNKIEKKEILIPCEIFNENLSGLETICKYLKENLNLKNKEIASLLNRNERTVWQAYDSSKKKLPNKIIIEFSKYYFPISILTNRDYAVLESIVKYLKEIQNLKYHEIAILLKRNDRTIWTVYQRSLKKNSKKLKENYVK